MMALEDYAGRTKINPLYREFIKIRASQINGCVYCIELHNKDALVLGECERRIYDLSAWRESTLFSGEERALPAAGEEITNISFKDLSEETYGNLKKYFNDEIISDIIMINVTINSWNRIAVSCH